MPLLLARRTAHSGRYLSVWSWRDAIASVESDGNVRVELRDGGYDQHSWDLAGWCIEHERLDGKATRVVLLGGIQGTEEDTPISQSPTAQKIPLGVARASRDVRARRGELSA